MVGFTSALTFLLPIFEAGLFSDVAFSLLIGGGIGGYLALRKDAVGSIARDVVGDTSNKAARGAIEKATEIEQELELTDKLKTKTKQLFINIVVHPQTSIGSMHLVLVLTRHQSQSEQSYLEKWPFGGQIWFEPAAAQIHVNQHLVRNFEHTGTLRDYGH